MSLVVTYGLALAEYSWMLVHRFLGGVDDSVLERPMNLRSVVVGDDPQPELEAPLNARRRCGHLRDIICVARALARAWIGRHMMCAGNALISVIALFVQYAMTLPDDVARVFVVPGLVFGFLSFGNSAVSLLFVSPDPRFRTAILIKSCLRAVKSMLASVPVSGRFVPMASLWSCGPAAFCPDWCKETLRGTCRPASDTCVCSFQEVNWIMVIFTTTSSFVLLGLTILDFMKIFRIDVRRQNSPWCDCLSLPGVIAFNVTSFLPAAMTAVLPLTCFFDRPVAAFTFAVALVPLDLCLNEAKWMLETWNGRPSDVPQIRSSKGLRLLAAMYIAAAVAAGCKLHQLQGEVAALPRYARPHEGAYDHVQGLVVPALVLPMIFAPFLFLLQPKTPAALPGGEEGQPAPADSDLHALDIPLVDAVRPAEHQDRDEADLDYADSFVGLDALPTPAPADGDLPALGVSLADAVRPAEDQGHDDADLHHVNSFN